MSKIKNFYHDEIERDARLRKESGIDEPLDMDDHGQPVEWSDADEAFYRSNIGNLPKPRWSNPTLLSDEFAEFEADRRK